MHRIARAFAWVVVVLLVLSLVATMLVDAAA
jgi:hypothetical protein